MPPEKGGSQWDEQDKLEAILEWIRKEFKPGQIYSYSDLERWATENGFVKSDNNA